MKKISVFVTDDHALFRQGVINTLQPDSGIEITGEAETLKGLLEAEELEQTEVLMLDISLGEDSSVEAIPELKNRYPDLKIIILSMHDKPVLLKRVINLGISGYLLKQSPSERLLEAVKIVNSGKRYLDPELSESIFTLLCNCSDNEKNDALYNSLSNREQEIFRMLAEGSSTARIAIELFISRKTVENHRAKILSKLKLNSSADIVQLGEKLGVI